MAYVNLGQIVYPVGAVYISANSTSPANLFGGSWTQITNATLRGATWVGYNGSDTHALSVNEMPSHSHEIWTDPASISGNSERVRMHLGIGRVGNYSEAIRDGAAVPTGYTIVKAVGGRGSTHQRATLLQLLYLAAHKLKKNSNLISNYIKIRLESK